MLINILIQNKEIKINITYALFTYVLMIASIIFINIPFIESKIKKTDSKTEIIKNLYYILVY